MKNYLLLMCLLFGNIGCKGQDWRPSALEVRIDSLTDTTKTRTQLLSYIYGKYLYCDSLVTHDTVRGEYFWPIYIGGIPGRLYIAKPGPEPPGIAENTTVLGVSWISFSSRHLDTLNLAKWMPKDIQSLSKKNIFDVFMSRIGSLYRVKPYTGYRSHYMLDGYSVEGTSTRLWYDSSIEVQFLREYRKDAEEAMNVYLITELPDDTWQVTKKGELLCNTSDSQAAMNIAIDIAKETAPSKIVQMSKTNSGKTVAVFEDSK